MKKNLKCFHFTGILFKGNPKSTEGLRSVYAYVFGSNSPRITPTHIDAVNEVHRTLLSLQIYKEIEYENKIYKIKIDNLIKITLDSGLKIFD